MRKYKARSIAAAEKMVERLKKAIAERDSLIETLLNQRNLMARLASRTPMFFNPIVAWDAEKLRDEILRGNL